MKNKQRRATYEIALSAICTGLILLLLWLSVVARYASLSFFIGASCVLMIPLTKRYWFAALFAYAASSALGFVVVGDIFSILGFVGYFGPMTLLSVFMFERKVKLLPALAVKGVLAAAAIALIYLFTDLLFLDFSAMGINFKGGAATTVIVVILGVLLALLLDTFMLYLYSKLKPLFAKIIKDNSETKKRPYDASISGSPKVEEDIFSEYGATEHTNSDGGIDGGKNEQRNDADESNGGSDGGDGFSDKGDGTN